MPKKPVIKYTIGLPAIVFFTGLALFFDLLKFLLLFTDIIPFIGIPIGELGTLMVSFLEILLVYGGLWFAGAYRGKSGTTNTLLTLTSAGVDLIPLVDHLPATTAAAVTIIIRSRLNDRVQYRARVKRAAHEAKQEQEREVKIQAAQRAVQNANANREQALATSIAVAQSQNSIKQAA